MLVRVLLATLITTLATAVHAAPLKDAGAIVLCYHVVESPSDTQFSLGRDAFLQQMQYLSASGYNVISLEELTEYVAGKRKSIPENAVVITIDDGWRCTYNEIFPVMKQFKFPFTVFVYPKFVNQSAYALTWKQIREMSDEGVDVQSHSLSHGFLTRRKHSMGPKKYSEWLTSELEESRSEIEKRTGRSVKYIAYPYGDYNSEVAQRTEEAGYEAGLTCDAGPVVAGSDRFRMKRVMVFGNTSFESFRRLLGTAPLQLAQTSPAAGTALDPRRPIISAKIPNFEKLDSSTITMSVLSLGNMPSFFDAKEGTISMIARDTLRGSIQQAVVWARDKSGKRVEASWSFLVPGAVDELPAKPAKAPAVVKQASHPGAAKGTGFDDRAKMPRK